MRESRELAEEFISTVVLSDKVAENLFILSRAIRNLEAFN